MRYPWVSAGLAVIALAIACAPGSAEALQYNRARVMAGEVWLLLSSQWVHWTARMAWADLGVLLGLGVWLETRGERRALVLSLSFGAVLTSLAVHALSPDLFFYRGSSGLASALFVQSALVAARSADRVPRALAVLAAALFLAKAAWESLSGQTLFAGPLGPGVRVVPLVHLLGGMAGFAGGARGHRVLAVWATILRMRLWIDADAAPRDVKEIVFRAARRLRLETVLVANQRLSTPLDHPFVTTVQVKGGPDVADQHIAENAEPGDLAVTADIPLAARLVEKQVAVIDPRGEEYTAENVRERLAVRDFMDGLRGAGVETSGPRPYVTRDRQAFAATLDRVLTRLRRERR